MGRLTKAKDDPPGRSVTATTITNGVRDPKTGRFVSSKLATQKGPGSPSPLLALPAERRNDIYELVLVQPDDVTLFPSKPNNWLSHQPLLRTCRQIRSEAAPIYYGQNRFLGNVSLDDVCEFRCDGRRFGCGYLCQVATRHFKNWLGTIGQVNAELIHSIKLDINIRLRPSDLTGAYVEFACRILNVTHAALEEKAGFPVRKSILSVTFDVKPTTVGTFRYPPSYVREAPCRFSTNDPARDFPRVHELAEAFKNRTAQEASKSPTLDYVHLLRDG